jgi:pimeloyl-ACP methyl ester carboxylesterase
MSDSRALDQMSRQSIREELTTNILVEAGAGSGKTQMLAERMAAGVAAGVYKVEHMVAVTFTRKAASELRGRFHLALEAQLARAERQQPESETLAAKDRDRILLALSNLERFFAGTIHSFCARLLRERPVESGVSPGFTELDEAQDLELRQRTWREFIANTRAAGDLDMLALLDAGVRPKDLDFAFATFCANEDVHFPPGEAQFLAKHLHKKKIIMLGMSWGSILGIHMAHARPDLFYAYVGMAQLVNTRKEDSASYARVLELARAAGDQQAITALTTIGPPPWHSVSRWPVFRKCKKAYQAKIVTAPAAPETLSPEYGSPEEQAQYEAADDFNFMHFWGMTLSGPLMDVDLPALGTDFAIPIFIIQGQEDLTAVPELAKTYFDSIKAPRKEFYLVPGTGHGTSATELDMTLKVLVEQVRPLVLER